MTQELTKRYIFGVLAARNMYFTILQSLGPSVRMQTVTAGLLGMKFNIGELYE
jgi:hypothetical protein